MKEGAAKYNLFLIALLFIAGCEREYSWKFQSENNNRLIVDGIITNELKAQSIKLSLSNNGMNSAYRPYSGANITVNDGDSLYEFTESTEEPGIYYSTPFQAVAGKIYSLIIVTGTIYEATANMVPVTPLETLWYEKHAKNDLYRYVYSDDMNPSMVEVYYDWSEIPGYCENYGSCRAMETFYTLNNIDVNKEFGPDKEIIWFPEGTKIIRRKYSLSEEHQTFLRSLLMETDWSGGLFDVQHGNVNTNLNNGALGFFGVCMVVSDTTIAVNVDQ
jgi:hypothetical protein